MKEPKDKTRWHRLLGKMLEELLTSEDITVTTELQVMSEPPRADILLLRKHTPRWTDSQQAILPDGIRETKASHILIEFKYSESINQDALTQALAYDTLYGKKESLPRHDLQSFIVGAKTPNKTFLESFGYEKIQEKTGVYHSRFPLLNTLPILSLNDLDNQPHNQFFKCFASRKNVKEKAFRTIFDTHFSLLQTPLQWFISGLWKNWFDNTGEGIMEQELTPEKVIEIGKKWEKIYLNSLPLERRLAGLNPQERLAGLKPKERLAGLKPKERLAGLKPKERLAGLKPKERLAGLSPEEIKELEKYIEQLKKNN